MAGLPEQNQQETTLRPDIIRAMAIIASGKMPAALVSKAFDKQMTEWTAENRDTVTLKDSDLITGPRPSSLDDLPLTPEGRRVIAERFLLLNGRVPNPEDPDDVANLDALAQNRWSS